MTQAPRPGGAVGLSTAEIRSGHAARRPLPRAAPAGDGRDGDRVPGRGRAAGARSGDQAAAHRRARGEPAALRAGGQAGRRPQPPQPGRDLRHGGRRGGRADRDGVRPRQAALGAGGAADEALARVADPAQRRRRARSRPRRGRGTSRRQARQRAGGGRRHGQARRPRDRQGDRRQPDHQRGQRGGTLPYMSPERLAGPGAADRRPTSMRSRPSPTSCSRGGPRARPPRRARRPRGRRSTFRGSGPRAPPRLWPCWRGP